jgi:autotransporter-associated beta strand protein
MQRRPFSTARLTITLACAITGALASSPAVQAANLTWDAGNTGNTTTIDPLSGSWNITDVFWNDAGTNVAWSQTSTTDGSNAAIFAGTDGTLDQYVVTLGAQMAAESLAFNSSGYQITGSPLAVILSPTANGSIAVAAGKTATINAQIVYNDNRGASITVGAGGILNLGGGATNSQYNFGGAGTINMTAGTYTANTGSVAVSTFNQTGGNFNMTPGNNVRYNISSDARNVIYTISGTGILALNGSSGTALGTALNIGNNTTGSFTSTLNVNGGTVNVGTTTGRQGSIRISNTATSNGKLDVQSGNLTVGTGNTTNLITLFENGASATYSATMTQSGGTVTANGIQFGGAAGTYDAASSATLTLSGGELYVGAAGITRGTAAGTLPTTIQLQGGTLGASQAWTSPLDMKLGTTGGGPTIRAQNSGTTARNITLSGILSNDGAVNGTLTKTGAGTLTLSGANTFTGGLTIINGTVSATTSDSALGAGTVSMGGAGSTGATLTTGRNHTNAFTVNAPDSGSVVIAANGGGGNYTLSGGITLNGNLTLQTFNNAISGATKAGGTFSGGITGTGNVVLDNIGLAANTFSLTTTAINHAGSLTLQGTGTGNTTISANIGSNVTGITQNSATSRMTLSGNNSYTGRTSITSGTLLLGSVTALPASAPLTLGGGTAATLATGGFSNSTGILTLGIGTNVIDFGNGGNNTLTFSNTAASGANTLQIWNWSGTLGDPLGGSDKLIFSANDGALNLASINFYSGDNTGSPLGGGGAMLLGSGELVPVPEPTALASVCALVGGALLRRRRQA